MPTLEQEAAQRTKLVEALTKLEAIQPESLVRIDELGKDLNFSSALPIFRRTLRLFRDLKECSLDDVPAENLEQLTNTAIQVFRLFEAISNFSLAQNPSNPVAARDSLIQQVRDQWQGYYSLLTPHIAYSAQRGTDFDSLEREARGTLAFQKQQADEFAKEKARVLAEMEGALAQVRRAASEAGVAQHAIHFKEEAVYFRNQSRWWLGIAVAFAIITIGYALASIGPQLKDVADPTMAKLVPVMVPRLIVLFVLSFGLVWATKNYSACRHNFVVNRHRQNALSSFETFVKGASDSQTKDAVLIQATQSIFAPQESAFSKSDVALSPASQIVELVRGASGKGEH